MGLRRPEVVGNTREGMACLSMLPVPLPGGHAHTGPSRLASQLSHSSLRPDELLFPRFHACTHFAEGASKVPGSSDP